jgi:uncharacterized protein (TIGR03032 family)
LTEPSASQALSSLAASNGEAKGDPVFSVNTSRGFAAWLKHHNASLAVTTYQVGKLFFFGVRPNGELWVFNRNIGRCLGLAVTSNELWVTGDIQIFKFVNALEEKQKSKEGHDALFVPQVSYYTADLDAHDLVVTSDNTPIFVNTLFNCLATVSTSHSFAPLWKPRFISRLAAEDRCHLNGVALRDGGPAFVTAVANSDTFDGWRDQRQSGGILIDVESNEIVCSGLSMPHSPRWHSDRLWLHNSGAGEFGWVDLKTKAFNPLCFCPGYLRGLSFIGNFAIMGLSKPRDNKTFSELMLDHELGERKMEPRCGLYVVDLDSGDVAHSLTIEGIVTELYDVVVIPQKTQPAALGPMNTELRSVISIGSM